MKQEQFNKHLREKPSGGVQGRVLTKLLHFVKMSTDQTGRYHSSWEEAEDVYRGYRVLDKKDAKSISKGEPPKLILPISYAATQTALAFMMSTIDEKLLQLKGKGPEDQRVKEAYEIDLNYQLSKQKAFLVFYQWFQDAFKYGVGIVEDCWEETFQSIRTRQTQQEPTGLIGNIFGTSPKEILVDVVQKIKTFEGTRLRNITPYSFYPDPSVPMAQFQEGQFCACEDETTIAEIRSKEGSVYYGTEHIKDVMPSEVFNMRTHRVGRNSMFRNAGSNAKAVFSDFKLGGAALKTRIEFKTTKKELKKEFDYDLEGYPDGEPVTMVGVFINDQKLVKFEPLGYLHNKFSWNLIEYSPDHNSFSNPGLGDTIKNLQDLSTWMLNSHVINVKKNIKNRLVVNPEFVEIADITGNQDVIRLKKGVQGRDIRQFIYSLELNDITRNHVNDIQVLNSFIQIVTGINENTLGQYSGGRRSAAQTQNVQSASTARLKMHKQIFWTMGIEPLAQKMIANTNQLRSEEYWNNILGEEVEKYPFSETIVTDPSKIINGFDFHTIDGTMNNDRERQQFLLNELLGIIFKNPIEIQQLTGANLNKLLEHYYDLHGFKNSEDFFNHQGKIVPPQTEVLPDEQVLNNQDNLVPV